MARSGRLKVVYIENQNARKNAFKKKIKALMKRAHDLAILCNLTVCLIFFSREEDKLVVWPSLHEAKSLIEKVFSLSDFARKTKAMDRDTYLKKKIQKMKTNLATSKKVIEEFEIDHLMFQLQCGRALNDLSQTEVHKLISYSENKIMCLRKKLGSTEHPPNASVGNEIPRALNVASEWPGTRNSFNETNVQKPCDETHLPKKVPPSFNLNVEPFDLNEEPFEEENEKTYKGESSRFGGEDDA